KGSRPAPRNATGSGRCGPGARRLRHVSEAPSVDERPARRCGRAALHAGLESRTARLEAGLGGLARVVTALERDRLRLVDALVIAVAAGDGRLLGLLALRGLRVEGGLHRILAGLAVGPARLDAVVVEVATGILPDLEVLAAVGATGLVGRLRIEPALLRILDRSAARQTGVHAGLERRAARLQRGLVVLANLIATLEPVELGVVDALVALQRPRTEDLLAVRDRVLLRVVAGPDRRVEAGGITAVGTLLAARLDADVVLVDAGVLG